MKKATPDLATVRTLHQAGQLDAAKAGYLALLKHHPHDSEILHALGILYAQQDNLPEAISCLESAIREAPTNPVLSLHLANILKTQGLFHQAADVLMTTLEKNPDYAPALNNLGTVYYAESKLSDAVQAYHAAIHHQPDYVDAYYNLGLALTKQNRLPEAIQAYTTLLTFTPDHAAALFLLACLHMQLNHTEQARTYFLTIEQSHPHHFETQTNLATCHLKLGQFDLAKAHYLKALDLMPEDTQILFNLGFLTMQQGHLDSAIQYYQRAIHLQPDFFAAHNNIGVAFLAKQHIGFALQHFQTALQLQPDNAAVRYTVNALSNDQRLQAAPPDYVKSLFDAYADHYEPHLLAALDYQVPTLLVNAIHAVSHQKGLTILDLGCGTGLCGVALKPLANTLIGVDLSDKMLAVAAQKNIYDDLLADSITHYLANTSLQFDLIVAGDVFVYVGDLTQIFQDARKALPVDGLFAFNTEISSDDDYQMNQSGRFAHSKTYLDRLAHENRLKVAYYATATTRLQNNEPVYGHLYILKAIP